MHVGGHRSESDGTSLGASSIPLPFCGDTTVRPECSGGGIPGQAVRGCDWQIRQRGTVRTTSGKIIGYSATERGRISFCSLISEAAIIEVAYGGPACGRRHVGAPMVKGRVRDWFRTARLPAAGGPHSAGPRGVRYPMLCVHPPIDAGRFQVALSATTSNVANGMTRRQRSGSCE